jgi:phage terminase large subunit GpA-like protein
MHPTLKRLLNQSWCRFVREKRVRPSVWAETKRFISAKSAEMEGKFSWALVPFLRGVIDALDEPGIRGVRCQKSAQVGWSESVLCNLLGYIIDVMPAPMLVLFPKLDKGKEFNLERFEPMVEVTPSLAAKVPITTREKGITQTHKHFAGGWLKFVGSHSPDAVKSSSVRYAFIEEPDDCERDVKGQGSTLKLLMERLKTYYDTMSFIGGTPTLKKLSAIEAEMDLTDKRRWAVPCNTCGADHFLEWENVRWRKDEAITHPVYGQALPDTTYYMCPHCQAEWSDAQKNANVRRGRWVATAPFTGLAGFYVNDLMSNFPGAQLGELARKYLEAVHIANQGDIKALVEFWNNQLGLAFEYKSPAPDIDELEARAEDYPEGTVPHGGLRLTIGADVQGNRIAVSVIAWGRGEESWRVFAGEIFGNPVDPNDAVWTDLESYIFRPYRHASGAELHVEMTAIDASDGNTSDAVYNFCRKHKSRKVIAIKGRDTGEIFRPPLPIDPNGRSKASRYGLQVYMVGTEKAKDLLIGYGEHGGRLRLSEKRGDRIVTGNGAGRMHWYRGIRGDWYAQISSEIKAPLKGRPRNKLYWQVKSGVRNEFLDTEVYALHAARVLRINLMHEAHWIAIEMRLRQPDLVGQAQAAAIAPPVTPAALPAAAASDPPPPPAKPKIAMPQSPLEAVLLGQLNRGQGGGGAAAPWK